MMISVNVSKIRIIIKLIIVNQCMEMMMMVPLMLLSLVPLLHGPVGRYRLGRSATGDDDGVIIS